MAVGIVSKKVLRMTFTNALGAGVSYSVSNPLEDLTAAAVQTFMDLVIAKNLFNSTGGDLVAIKDIAIVDTTTQDLFDVAIA
ncbi:MAG TPA: DUF2922 domain-containing protein [Desulfosporosinus sp.]|nr:DUF2922 domain-containing protein [Desulfosporosinus sp.]